MTSLKQNKTILIDKEAAAALELLKDGLLLPVDKLMNEAQSKEILQSGMIDGQTFPFPFILAPSGKKNQEVLKGLKKGEEITILYEKKPFATLVVDETFKIDPKERIKQIYGTTDISHPGLKATLSRIGEIAISGEYQLLNAPTNNYKQLIAQTKEQVGATHTTALVMAANPLHRAHEKLIRQTLDNTDLLVIFLLKPYNESNLSFEIRKETLEFYINNFLTKNHVVVVPLENSYIFAGYNEIIIDAIVAKNYGCDKLTIGRNHAGLGMFYDSNANKSILDKIVGLDIEISVSSEFVYCDKCTTLVSKNTCPHGQHHQISYNSTSILELLELGILPPTILVRKEISASIISKLYPNRFKNLEKLYYDILPIEGLLRDHTENDFYLELMKLYQTTSLT
ncbi:MAG: sulfate adenylyltransferase [Sulfurimonadaceae bacterium]|nr:sulfate adenylyltransferase [Sulfurimonadaceae bacterium]